MPDDQADIERWLEFVAALPNGGAVASLITGDYRRANLQIQMRDGDNQAMEGVVYITEAYLREQSLPAGIRTAWATLRQRRARNEEKGR